MPLSREFADVAPVAGHLGRKIVVVDVGCRWGFADRWSKFAPNLTLIGFDADSEECRRLTELHKDRCECRFVPEALGPERGRVVLHLTREPGCNSIYPPDVELIDHRPLLECMRPQGSMPISVRTLDDWAKEAGVERIDFMKLDAQGAELGILEGAERCLGTVRAIEAEVMFNPIYLGEPLFGDIDRYLRGRGFTLWRLSHLVHYTMAEVKEPFQETDVQFFDSQKTFFPTHAGQIFWGHAYYVRNDLAFAEDTRDWRSRLLDGCLASALGFRDLAGWALEQAARYAPPLAAAAIREALMNGESRSPSLSSCA